MIFLLIALWMTQTYRIWRYPLSSFFFERRRHKNEHATSTSKQANKTSSTSSKQDIKIATLWKGLSFERRWKKLTLFNEDGTNTRWLMNKKATKQKTSRKTTDILNTCLEHRSCSIIQLSEQYHDISWDIMRYHEISCDIMWYHVISPNITKYHQISRKIRANQRRDITKYHEKAWRRKIYHVISRNITKYHTIWKISAKMPKSGLEWCFPEPETRR